MDNSQFLRYVFAYQHYKHVIRNGKIYGTGLFYKIYDKAITYLEHVDSRAGIKLWRFPKCVVCGEPLSDNSYGDHIIPKALGGTDALENRIPLCPSHNESKGKKDFLEWWVGALRLSITYLDPDVLAIYAKQKYKFFKDQQQLYNEVSDIQEQIVEAILTDINQWNELYISESEKVSSK